jgi:RNA polymerase-interacting CarD/CdnL/TRCF family regulator
MSKEDWPRKRRSGAQRDGSANKTIEPEGGTEKNMSNEMYSKGDWLVHSNYGVGQVKGKVRKSLGGEKKTFFKVETFTSEYFLQTKHWDVPYIRRLSSDYQMKRALSILRKPPKPLNKHHKERYNQILEATLDVSIYTKARMIRDLYGRQRAGKLNFRDKESLKMITAKFLNEWSVVSDQEIDVLREKLNKALQTSFKKIKKDESWLERIKKGVKVSKNQESTS